MIYLVLYIVIVLITTGLLYWFLYDDNDTEIISILGGMVFPLTVVFLFFCIPVFIVNKLRNR